MGLLSAVMGCGRIGAAGDAAPEADEAPSSPSSEVTACLTQFPSALPFDIGDTPAPVPPPPARVDPASAAAAGLQALVEQCATEGGQDCDSADFISKQAAICIGQSSGGVADAVAWAASLELRGEDDATRVAWRVLGTGPRDDQCCATGWWFQIDANSGEIVSQAQDQRLCCVEF